MKPKLLCSKCWKQLTEEELQRYTKISTDKTDKTKLKNKTAKNNKFFLQTKITKDDLCQ